MVPVGAWGKPAILVDRAEFLAALSRERFDLGGVANKRGRRDGPGAEGAQLDPDCSFASPTSWPIIAPFARLPTTIHVPAVALL